MKQNLRNAKKLLLTHTYKSHISITLLVTKWKKAHGRGLMKWREGDKYEGEWYEGFRHGTGTYFSKVCEQDTGNIFSIIIVLFLPSYFHTIFLYKFDICETFFRNGN